MLERKKLLRETDTQRTGTGLLRIYEHRKSGDVFIVKDPQIPLDKVEDIQEEIHQLLNPEPLAPTDELAPSSPQEEATKSETVLAEATS